MFPRASSVIRRRYSLNVSQVANLEKLLRKTSNCTVVSPDLLRSDGIVLVLGWTASRIRSIVRYANIYSELGLPCVCAAPSLAEVWSASFGNAKAQKILRGVNESVEEGCGLILHLFSGAGFTFLPTIVKEVTSKNSKFHLSGIVFDSGPVPFNQRAGLAAARLMKEQGGYGTLSYYTSCSVGIAVNAIVGRVRRRSMRAVLDHPLLHQVPQLYLYSSSDSVALVDEVEDEMRLQVSRGADVSSHRWNDSEHVKHFVEHPEEYTWQISNFVQKLRVVV